MYYFLYYHLCTTSGILCLTTVGMVNLLFHGVNKVKKTNKKNRQSHTCHLTKKSEITKYNSEFNKIQLISNHIN